jgi:hypothetical protein
VSSAALGARGTDPWGPSPQLVAAGVLRVARSALHRRHVGATTQLSVPGGQPSVPRPRPTVPCQCVASTQQATVLIQRLLDELHGAADVPMGPLAQKMFAHSVTRFHWLCDLMLQRQYPRLTRGPLNLTADELLSGVAERLIKAIRKVRPETVPQYFAPANRHVRWELNDSARRLDIEGNSPELRHSQHAAPIAGTGCARRSGRSSRWCACRGSRGPTPRRSWASRRRPSSGG